MREKGKETGERTERREKRRNRGERKERVSMWSLTQAVPTGVVDAGTGASLKPIGTEGIQGCLCHSLSARRDR